MLTELHIDNFAIIQHLELDFSNGLITFTGETGAGKSIILDAILALMGSRTDTSFIRSGSERAIIEGTFQLNNPNRKIVHEILKREDMLDDGDYVVLCRELRAEGRNIARVNGHNANVSLLRELGSFLVDIHGQSEHLSLLNTRQHIYLLDRYALVDKALESYQHDYHQFQAVRLELNTLQKDKLEAERMNDLLSFQSQEIQSARLQIGEEEDLKQERDRLANAEALASEAQQALVLLDETNIDSPSISEQMGHVIKNLSTLSRIDLTQSKLLEQAESLQDTINDLTRSLRDYLEQIEFNPKRLEQVEERLNLIQNLKRKYGGSIENILAYAEDARQKLENMAQSGERIDNLQILEKTLLEKLAKSGSELSQIRKEAAKTMAESVEMELKDLNMEGAGFNVEIRQENSQQGLPIDGEKVAFDENGIDRVEFMIAPNPGEGFKPLVKIASGGETARLMLALKSVLARADTIPTLIFDEIDQGVGGRVGMVVGEKLWRLARRHQVFCVTHLPQLAAFGDQHLGVRKLVEEGRTRTEVNILSNDERQEELAIMIGGLNDANRKAARQTLDLAQQRTVQLSAT